MQRPNIPEEFQSTVIEEDLKQVKSMNKDQLHEYAKRTDKFNLVLDKLRPFNQLKNQVIGLIKTRLFEEKQEKQALINLGGGVVNPKEELSLGYLLNPVNNKVVEATNLLLNRVDLLPCDKDGKRI